MAHTAFGRTPVFRQAIKCAPRELYREGVMLAAATIIVVTATIQARVASNSGMSNTNARLVVFSAIVATVAAAVCALAGVPS
jgi:Kef-type K+ transport system membrane component KefB